MNQEDYLQPLAHCTLCEHRCGVNRLDGETGICRMTVPVSETVQEGLVGFAHNTMAYTDKPFQKRIEDVTINLISDASL